VLVATRCISALIMIIHTANIIISTAAQAAYHHHPHTTPPIDVVIIRALTRSTMMLTAPSLMVQVSFNTVMASLKSSQWRRALELLEEMEAHGVEPDLFSFNTAMDVCGKAGNWEKVRIVHLVFRGMSLD
jgi:pentatricopeptide repeat protein